MPIKPDSGSLAADLWDKPYPKEVWDAFLADLEEEATAFEAAMDAQLAPAKYSRDQPRGADGRWSGGGGSWSPHTASPEDLQAHGYIPIFRGVGALGLVELRPSENGVNGPGHYFYTNPKDARSYANTGGGIVTGFVHPDDATIYPHHPSTNDSDVVVLPDLSKFIRRGTIPTERTLSMADIRADLPAALAAPVSSGAPSVGSDHGKPYIGVKAGAIPNGEHGNKQNPRVLQENGAQIRGLGMSLDDPRLPAVLYHATSNLPAVLKDGYLRAGGTAPTFGTTETDRAVSLTASKPLAEQLARDIAIGARVSRIPVGQGSDRAKGIDAIFAALHADAAQYRDKATGEPWVWKGTPDAWDYSPANPNDPHGYLSGYLEAREKNVGIKNPRFWTTRAQLAQIDPEHAGVLAIPKENLATGAQLMDLDLDESPGSLREVRLMGDLPIGKQTAKATAPSEPIYDVLYLASEGQHHAAETT